MNTPLSIGIPCGNNSDFFCNFLLENIVQTKSENVRHKVIVGINNYDKFDLSIFDKFNQHLEIDAFFIKTDTLPSSVGHALTLHSILDRMNNSTKLGLFLDVDTAFLANNWDQVFVNETKENCLSFGVSYQKLSKYQNFPNMVACSFDIEKTKNLKIDFRPLMNPPDSRYIVKNDLEARAWGKKIGDLVVLDTGYQFPLKATEAGYFGKVIPYCKDSVLGIGQEFHYLGKPFITHMKGSSTCDKNHPITKTWTSAVNNYFLRLAK